MAFGALDADARPDLVIGDGGEAGAQTHIRTNASVGTP